MDDYTPAFWWNFYTKLSDKNDHSARDEFDVTGVLPLRSKDGTNTIEKLKGFLFYSFSKLYLKEKMIVQVHI